MYIISTGSSIFSPSFPQVLAFLRAPPGIWPSPWRHGWRKPHGVKRARSSPARRGCTNGNWIQNGNGEKFYGNDGNILLDDYGNYGNILFGSIWKTS